MQKIKVGENSRSNFKMQTSEGWRKLKILFFNVLPSLDVELSVTHTFFQLAYLQKFLGYQIYVKIKEKLFYDRNLIENLFLVMCINAGNYK